MSGVTNSTERSMLQDYDIFVLPLANPDAFVYTRTHVSGYLNCISSVKHAIFKTQNTCLITNHKKRINVSRK